MDAAETAAHSEPDSDHGHSYRSHELDQVRIQFCAGHSAGRCVPAPPFWVYAWLTVKPGPMQHLMDGLDEEAQRVLQGAHEAAVSAGHSYIGTEHLLFGLMADEISTANLLQSLGGESTHLREFARKRLRPNPKREGDPLPTEDFTAAVTTGREY